MWWHVYPLGFVGADPTGADRSRPTSLQQLEPWLDYVADLGLDGLALGPVFDSGSHGYDTTDHFRVDTRLGDESALTGLIGAARDKGLRVLLDGVFNHVGRDFARFRDAAAGDAEAAGWFRREGDGWRTFEGHQALVALNHDSPAVREYTAAVMRYWLDRGAAGWRLDAAYAVPTGFWSHVLADVRTTHPDAYFLGEVLHGDYAAFVAASGVDTVTQYELWKAIWSSLADGNFFELAWALKRHNVFAEAFVPYTFIGNHDVTRLASQVRDPRHRVHALVVLCTVAGDPSVYYGDEQGWEGVKENRAGGDDAVRPAFPATPADLPPGGRPTYDLHRQLLGLRRDNPWLQRAQVCDLTLTNTRYTYRVSSGDRAFVVTLNLGDEPVAVDADGEVRAGDAQRDGRSVVVPPHGWVITG